LVAGVIAGSLLLTNLSTEQLVGLNGSAYRDGMSVMAWETLAAIAMVVTAVFLLPRYLKGGLTTIPQFLAERFDVTTKTITSGLFLTGYVVVLLPVILYSGGLAIRDMFDVSTLLGISKDAALVSCIWGIGIIGSIYAVFGGLKAVAVSDSINAIGLMIGGILIPVFGLMAIGDGSVFTGLDNLMTANPERFDSTGAHYQEVPFLTIFTGMMLVQLFYWGTNQLILVLPGMIAYYYFEGKIDMNSAYPELVRAVLPKPLVGFFAAVLFGAILSSFNSVLNSSVTLFGMDIYKQHINPQATEKIVVKYGKIFGICLALAAMFIAPLIANAGSIFDYLQKINGIYNIPIFTIIAVGYLTKKVPAIAAKIAIFLGSGLYIISQFIVGPNMVNKAVEAAKASGVTDETALRIVEADAYPHFLHVMALLFLLNAGIMLLIGYFKPRKEAFALTYTEQVSIAPYKYVKQVGIVICLIVAGIYIYFAK